jgi:ClpP class serine protease
MKNPVGTIGDVTKEGVVAMQDMVDRIHDAFREHVANAREGALTKSLRPLPNSKYFGLGETNDDDKDGVMSVIDQVANGDVFLGIQAKKLGLVDRLITSDEYISERIKHGARVLKLIMYHRPVTLSSLLAGNPPSRTPHVATGKTELLQALSNAFRNH